MRGAKRQKFSPQYLVLLLRLVKCHYGKPITWQHLAIQVLLELDMDEGDEGGFAESYLDKLYKESLLAIKRGEKIGKDLSRVDTLARYLGYADYAAFGLWAERLFDFLQQELIAPLTIVAQTDDSCEAFFALQEHDGPALSIQRYAPEHAEVSIAQHTCAFVLCSPDFSLQKASPSCLYLMKQELPAGFDREYPVIIGPYAYEMAAIAYDISALLRPITEKEVPATVSSLLPEAAESRKVAPVSESKRMSSEQADRMQHIRPSLVDGYFLMARLLPTVFLCLPLIPLLLILMQRDDATAPIAAWSPLLFWILVPLVLLLVIWGLALFLADHSKRLEKRYFQDRTGLPTTYLLTYAHQATDGFSKQEKKRIREKMAARFALKLPTEQEELSDPHEAKMLIADAMLHVRQYMGRGRLVYQQSVRYGFNRVAIAGAWLGFALSIATLIFSIYLSWYFMIGLSVVGLFIYGRWWLFSEKRFRQVAEDYARQLRNYPVVKRQSSS